MALGDTPAPPQLIEPLIDMATDEKLFRGRPLQGNLLRSSRMMRGRQICSGGLRGPASVGQRHCKLACANGNIF